MATSLLNTGMNWLLQWLYLWMHDCLLTSEWVKNTANHWGLFVMRTSSPQPTHQILLAGLGALTRIKYLWEITATKEHWIIFPSEWRKKKKKKKCTDVFHHPRWKSLNRSTSHLHKVKLHSIVSHRSPNSCSVFCRCKSPTHIKN